MTELKINSATVYHCDANWIWSPKSMPDRHLWTVISGEGQLQTSDETIRLLRGKSLLFKPGASCEANCKRSNPISVISIHFNAYDLGQKPFLNEIEDPALFEKILQKVVRFWNSGEPERANLWLEAALDELSKNDSATPAPGPMGESQLLIDGLCEGILQNPATPWKVAKMARRLNVCKDHFARLFRKRKGMSPNEFVIDARLDFAKCLLSASSHPVERIAELCGYKSLSFLTRQFKAKTGMTPSAFRRHAGGS